MAAIEIRRSETQDQVGAASSEDDSDLANLEELLLEVQVTIKSSTAKAKGYRVISEHVSILDIPGIEDGQHSIPIMAYIERFCDRIIPIVLINLTQGAFSKLVQFKEVIPKIN